MTQPYRLICDYTDTRERRYLCAEFPSLADALLALPTVPAAAWTSISLTPVAAHDAPLASVTGKRVLALGARHPQQAGG